VETLTRCDRSVSQPIVHENKRRKVANQQVSVQRKPECSKRHRSQRLFESVLLTLLCAFLFQTTTRFLLGPVNLLRNSLISDPKIHNVSSLLC